MSFTQIGDYSIQRVIELECAPFSAREFFPDLTAEMLETCRAELPRGALVDNDMLAMSFHTFILRTGRHTILIDTCCGNDKERPARPMFHRLNTNFMDRLAAAGVKPEQVDFVMCTHLHWDHVGWNTLRKDGQWVPTFPNAKYIMAKREYDHWDGVYSRGEKSVHRTSFEDSVLPLKRAEQAVLVEDDFELEKGIWLEPCPGHSPGNVVINLESKGARGVVPGDVLHHQIQLVFPEMSTMADADRNLARTTRTALIEKHAGTGHLILPAHFPTPTVGRIERHKHSFRYVT
ncbi:MAG: MBL fold metallo-hydrolase [Bacteroidota bacterium]|nr:MBL fold metallo-hydrolase [Hyphomicrobiaceae bacterium]